MQAKLVTVFGGSGFLGRHAVRALAQAGWRIRVAVRCPNRAFFLYPNGTVGQIAAIKCDVANPDEVAAALAGADAAINLTGILSPGGGQDFEHVHVTGAEVVAKAAAAAGVKTLIYVSALGADESYPSAYAQTKAKGEARVRAAFPNATILRPSVVFGAEDGFFNRFAGMISALPILPLIGGGKTCFQPVFVGDVAKAIMAALSREDARGKIYELGGPSTYTFKELMQIISKETERGCLFVPLPFGVALVIGIFTQILPNAPLTPDQVMLLKRDSVVSPTALTLADLGITANSVEAKVPLYLWRYRPKGEYAVSGPEEVL